MNENKVDIKDPTLLVDINEATLAVKESRFADALETLKINLSRYPDGSAIELRRALAKNNNIHMNNII